MECPRPVKTESACLFFRRRSDAKNETCLAATAAAAKLQAITESEQRRGAFKINRRGRLGNSRFGGKAVYGQSAMLAEGLDNFLGGDTNQRGFGLHRYGLGGTETSQCVR